MGMADAVNRTGCNLNISELTMGLVFLAAGTSVPDALGSIAVAKQGEGDMAVANALGSNVFDIFLGLGLPWLARTAQGKDIEFEDAKKTLPKYLGILVTVLFLFLATLVASRWRLSPWVGWVLMTF